MRVRSLVIAVVIGLGVFAAPIRAHHSVGGSHDISRVVTITGKLGKVSWLNPHVWMELSVTNANGDVVTQRVEIAAPGRLIKIGFDKTFLKLGDLVTIEAWMPKNDPRFTGSAPNGRTLILTDGRRFDVGDNWPGR